MISVVGYRRRNQDPIWKGSTKLSNIPSFTPGVAKDVTLYVFPAARKSLIFCLPGSLNFIFLQSSSKRGSDVCCERWMKLFGGQLVVWRVLFLPEMIIVYDWDLNIRQAHLQADYDRFTLTLTLTVRDLTSTTLLSTPKLWIPLPSPLPALR